MESSIPVSVIVPVYNDQAGLDRCIAALSHQSYPEDQYEIIIVDNGSEIPVRADQANFSNLRIIRCERPGAYAARNTGIAAACGDILAFTDADCVPTRHWLSCGVSELEQYEQEAVIGGQIDLHISCNATAVARYQALVGFLQRENIESRGFSATANLFVGRKQALRVGPFDENLLSGGDREWCWRALHQGLPVRYSARAIVATSPRTTLRGAVLQARRVAGGRRSLKGMRGKHIQQTMINSHRSGFSAASWIMQHPDLSVPNKLKMLAVGSILKLATALETARLRLGSTAERR